jgi:hypothetical protein
MGQDPPPHRNRIWKQQLLGMDPQNRILPVRREKLELPLQMDTRVNFLPSYVTKTAS